MRKRFKRPGSASELAYWIELYTHNTLLNLAIWRFLSGYDAEKDMYTLPETITLVLDPVYGSQAFPETKSTIIVKHW
jgi:hypothetical protein